MRKFLPQFILVTTALVGVGLFFAPHEAHAWNLLDVTGSITDFIYGLIGKIFWFGLIPITSWLIWLIGQVIDIALNLTLRNDFFSSPAITITWSIIRDLCNMAFIFVLIWGGLRTILNLSNVNVKKTITNVVIAALFINFSLFMTKVFIDASNVGTAWFVQGIENIGGGTGVSDSIRGILQMDKLTQNKAAGDSAITLASFVAGFALFIINCIAVYVLFQVAYFLIARIVVFVFLLVMSPIAFMGSLEIEELSKYSAKWWKDLRSQAIGGPMLFLMFYISLYIVDGIDNIAFGTGSSLPDPVTGSAFNPTNYVMFAIIIFMLLKCLETVEEYSGEMGKSIAGYLKSASGVALGAVTGGVGLIGRNTLGRAMVGKMEDQTYVDSLKDRQARGGISGFAARLQLGATEKMSKASFDARSTTLGGSAMSAFNPKISVAGIGVDASKVGAEEAKGFRGTFDATKEAEKKFAESLGKGKEGEMRRAIYAKTLENRLLYKAEAAGGSALGWATRVGTLGLVHGKNTGISGRNAALDVSKELADKAPENFLKYEKEDTKKKANKKQAQLATQKAMKEYLDKAQKTGSAEEMKRAALVTGTVMAQFGKALEKDNKDDYLKFIRGYDEKNFARAEQLAIQAEASLEEVKGREAKLKEELASEEDKRKVLANSTDSIEDKKAQNATLSFSINQINARIRDTMAEKQKVEKELKNQSKLFQDQETYRKLWQKASGSKDFSKDMAEAQAKFGDLAPNVWGDSAVKYGDYVNTFANTIKEANEKLAQVQKAIDTSDAASKTAGVAAYIKQFIIGETGPNFVPGGQGKKAKGKGGKGKYPTLNDDGVTLNEEGMTGFTREVIRAKFEAEKKLRENSEIGGSQRGSGAEPKTEKPSA